MMRRQFRQRLSWKGNGVLTCSQQVNFQEVGIAAQNMPLLFQVEFAPVASLRLVAVAQDFNDGDQSPFNREDFHERLTLLSRQGQSAPSVHLAPALPCRLHLQCRATQAGARG